MVHQGSPTYDNEFASRSASNRVTGNVMPGRQRCLPVDCHLLCRSWRTSVDCKQGGQSKKQEALYWALGATQVTTRAYTDTSQRSVLHAFILKIMAAMVAASRSCPGRLSRIRIGDAS